MPLTALAALLKGMASAHLSSQFDLLLTKLDQLQTDMVTPLSLFIALEPRVA